MQAIWSIIIEFKLQRAESSSGDRQYLIAPSDQFALSVRKQQAALWKDVAMETLLNSVGTITVQPSALLKVPLNPFQI